MNKITVDDIKNKDLILVVEDEMFIAMEIEQALEDGGFLVLGPVGSVSSALDLLEQDSPYAAVLDFNLGREKVTPVALKLQSRGIPFVLTSATSDTELARYGVLAAVNNLGKPTDMKRLVEAVRAFKA
ncbi:response regulator [Ochrobactrum sp. EDr1-4]|uniref:response regulator n=1 Tax=Ochrobactrum sp. EDr1-4 TaxID=3368622 RepID=UPI003BA0B401